MNRSNLTQRELAALAMGLAVADRKDAEHEFWFNQSRLKGELTEDLERARAAECGQSAILTNQLDQLREAGI